MKLIKIIVILGIIVLVGCTKGKVKKGYYLNGDLAVRIEYPDKKDTCTYKEIMYYKNGNIEHIYNYKDCKLEGYVYEYNENGVFKGMGYYRNGKRHGLTKLFNEDREIIKQGLYIHDSLIFFGRYQEHELTKETRQVVYDNTGKYPNEIGYIYYHLDGSYNKETSSYMNITGPDTIVFGEKYHCTFYKYNLHKGKHCKLKVGELNEFGEFVDSSSIKIVEVKDSALLTHSPKYLGQNILMGMVHLSRDTVYKGRTFVEYPFYKTYIVVPPH